MTASSDNHFEGLLDPIDGVDNVLKEVVANPPLDSPRLLFLRMRENEPQVNQFAELLTDQLVNYVVPLSKRQDANADGSQSRTGGDTAAAMRLRREAVRLLVKYSEANKARYGEIGELISYVVAVRFLGAAQIGAKMALKTSSEMPVHGVDGLHARANDDGTVTFYLLESKVIPDATDATRDMLKSVAEYQADYGRRLNELRLVGDLSNLDALQGAQRDAAKSFFNSYAGNGSHLLRRDIHVGSLVFNEDAYKNKLPRDRSKPITMHEDHFEVLYSAKHGVFGKNLSRQALDKSIDLGGCIVFLLAIPDVNELKRVFAEMNR
ncbi:DUF1837 domain-containing protein [Cupriavidus sp. MP-37]|uniref:HamA C-terminal domain-containing protein n=1 Tax=Cupriavidus sp. MP-37 TaxID=2884455 RepID=UPI001D09EA5B|nr:DUF1837 domain-containing protein [Cupriavidus sp. MP-37]UDM51955.1 DUF1837 domain-containing protein [Cupriavidus sp. MP-37]